MVHIHRKECRQRAPVVHQRNAAGHTGATGHCKGCNRLGGIASVVSAVRDGHRLFRNDREDEEKGCSLYEKAAQMQRMENGLHESS